MNRGVAHERHVVLELTHWKTDAYPGFHPEGPQGLIDPVLKIEDCDILLALFWKRLGTPAKGASSGAEHEIRTAIKARQDAGRPHIMIYFKEAARELKTPEELRQYASVLEFKQEISPLGLFWTFEDTVDFERKVRQHLTHYILDHIHPTAGESATAGSANHQVPSCSAATAGICSKNFRRSISLRKNVPLAGQTRATWRTLSAVLCRCTCGVAG
jgi:hypothetical protein